ncbi:MAG: hypothetical protein ACE5JJ_10070 [Nitrospinota bacterium]
MPYKYAVFQDKTTKKWIGEVYRYGAYPASTAKPIWRGTYDSEEGAKRAANAKRAAIIKKAEENIRKLAAEAKAERDKHGWKFSGTKAIIKTRHGSGRS